MNSQFKFYSLNRKTISVDFVCLEVSHVFFILVEVDDSNMNLINSVRNLFDILYNMHNIAWVSMVPWSSRKFYNCNFAISLQNLVNLTMQYPHENAKSKLALSRTAPYSNFPSSRTALGCAMPHTILVKMFPSIVIVRFFGGGDVNWLPGKGLPRSQRHTRFEPGAANLAF